MIEGLVSVIIPTYKRAKYIDRAIQSVLNQTYQNFELIVVDDNDEDSEDRKYTSDLMKQYDDNEKVIYLKHKKNMNGAVARNTGIKQARGEFITFLDDDDYYLPKRLEIMVSSLKNSEYSAAYSSVVIVKNKEIQNIKFASKSGNLQSEILKLNTFFGTGSNMFFVASAIKQINGFDETFLRHQDLEVLVRFFNYFKIKNVEDVLVVRNLDDRINSPNFDKVILYREKFLNTFSNEINKYDSNTKRQIYLSNYENIYTTMIENKCYKEKEKIRAFMQNYNIKLNWKVRLRLFLKYCNNYIPIKKLYLYIKNKKYKKFITNEIVSFIKENEK